jgi:lactate dehydrogenase-like 2-hydroxyacid dehydrogenase
MSKPEILLMGAYPDWDLVELEQHYEVHKIYAAANREAFLAQHSAEIRAIGTRGELGASAELMRALPRLEIVACYGVGTDAIDLYYARQNRIRVTNTPDVLTGDVADMSMALLLSAARKIPQADRFVRSGAWAQGNLELVTRVYGKTVGIVGMGRIGATVARRLGGFDCQIMYFDVARRDDLPYRFVGDLRELARQSEFLIVTLAGGEVTKSLVNAAVLEALGADGILVNVSRGSTVDETALIDALERRVIKGAALDVFWNEPNIDKRLLSFGNVVLQPHHASGTIETRKAMGKLVRNNLAAHFAGSALPTPVV